MLLLSYVLAFECEIIAEYLVNGYIILVHFISLKFQSQTKAQPTLSSN